jgi:Heterokaryon incompatibility protein (HET)
MSSQEIESQTASENSEGKKTEEEESCCANYVYQPLNSNKEVREFRLLKLLPAMDFNDDIRCELLYSPNIEYEALSYVWGDPDVTVPILLHGIPHPVTTNLELALRYIRYAEEPRVLWVDALCINQKDISEKNHQVAQMREIYLDSKQVCCLAWRERDCTKCY